MSGPAPREYMTFQAGEALFALPMDSIRELVPLPELQPPLQATAYVAGMMNLRGTWVPVIHLAARLSLPLAPASLDDRIVVVPAPASIGAGPGLWGLWVDQALGVVDLPPPTPPDRFALDPPQPRFLEGDCTLGPLCYHVPDLAVVLGEGAPAGQGGGFLQERGLGSGLDERFSIRAEELARPHEGIDNSAGTHLTFRLRQERFALPLSAVLHIRPWQTPMPVPGAPPGCLGVLAHRGGSTLVVDPAEALGLNGPEVPASHVILVADGAETLGLRIEDLEGTISANAWELQPMPEAHPALQGRWILGEETLALLDPSALADSLFNKHSPKEVP